MKWFHCVFFHHYLDLSERASRREYWWYNFVVLLIFAGSGAMSVMLSDAPQEVLPVIFAALGLVTLCPSYSVLVRRLHDIGRSGWWVMVMFLPVVGQLILLIFLMRKGQDQENKYGPPPIYFFE
ncbi:DUF805 domain-containing protein [Entomohabitans teleogrylli]|uniref:DUF805 domain-containing protein n=1 Tax=Entomohabitans teleogrylli TaxID=1384589 RepID=UPI00073D6BE8|nr:DUF805 domain-containing protein [Entomohabitans teleogrylli]